MSRWHYLIAASFSSICIFLLLQGIRYFLSLADCRHAGFSGKSSKGFLERLKISQVSARNRRMFLAGILLSMIIVLYLWFGSILLSLIVSVSALIIIIDLFSGLENRRLILLHGQLIGFINHMILMLRAGRTVRFIFENAADKFPQPLNLHLSSMAAGLSMGNTLSLSLDTFTAGCRSREASLLAAALKINQETGGDIIYVLENIAESLVSDLKSKSRARTLSLQGRFSANIISLFPVAVLVILNVFIGGRMTDFFSGHTGTWMLLAGGLLQITGILVIKKIFRNT